MTAHSSQVFRGFLISFLALLVFASIGLAILYYFRCDVRAAAANPVLFDGLTGLARVCAALNEADGECWDYDLLLYLRRTLYIMAIPIIWWVLRYLISVNVSLRPLLGKPEYYLLTSILIAVIFNVRIEMTACNAAQMPDWGENPYGIMDQCMTAPSSPWLLVLLPLLSVTAVAFSLLIIRNEKLTEGGDDAE